MSSKYEKRKKTFYFVILVLTFLTMIASASFAYYSLVASQEDEKTILHTGKLEINYIDGVYIKNPKLFPMTTPNYDTYDRVYRNKFSVVSSGTLDQTIEIFLDVSKNEFTEGTIKYLLYNVYGQELGRGNVPQSGQIKLVDNLFLVHDGTATYTLILWMDETYYNQNYEMGHNITGSLIINSKQIRY